MGQVSAEKRKKEEEVKQIKWWEGNHFPPPTSSPVPRQSLSSRCPLQSPSLSFHCQAQHIICHRISFWSVWVSCPGCAPSPHFVQPLPQWSVYRRSRVREKALKLHTHCSAAAEIVVCYQQCCGHKSKP